MFSCRHFWPMLAVIVGLALPSVTSAQEATYDTVSASIRALNGELEEQMKRLSVRAPEFKEEALAHIEARQAYYRLQRVARKAIRWGEQQYKVDAFAIARRPKGKLGALELNSLARETLEHVRKINKKSGITTEAKVGVLPGKLPGNLFSELGQTLAYLDTLSQAAMSGVRVRAAPAVPAETSDAVRKPKGAGRRR